MFWRNTEKTHHRPQTLSFCVILYNTTWWLQKKNTRDKTLAKISWNFCEIGTLLSIISSKFCQIYICVKFDKIIDNKVPISQTFHEMFANVLSLAFFFCYHQFVLYRMTQNLNFWGRWCDLSVSRQYIWYIQFVAYSFFYQSSIFFYWEECWKKQVVKKYNL